MNKPLFILFCLCLYAFMPVSAENRILEKGDIAIYIKYPEMPNRMEFSGENLANCLKNHLDYYLWYKEWDFQYIQADRSYDIDLLISQTGYSRYRYLLYLEYKAELDQDRLGLELNISFIDLKSG